MEKSVIITLSGKANCGKDLTANLIKTYCKNRNKKVLMLAYADFVKIVCARNFGYNESKKEETRAVLQHFGTDVVRKIEPDFWVRQVFHMIDVLRNQYDCFVITDARYENELGIAPFNLYYPICNVFIKRDEENALGELEKSHSSEKMSSDENLERYHYVIENNSTVDDLYEKVQEVMQDVFVKAENVREFVAQNNSENLFATLAQEETVEQLLEVIEEFKKGKKND